MGNSNRFSLVVPTEVVEEAKVHYSRINTLLAPYLVALTKAERKRFLKMGDKSYAFVQKSLEYMQVPGTPIQPYANVPEFVKDVRGFETYRQILQVSMPTIDLLKCTMVLSGSEAFTTALAFYDYIKGAAKAGVPGAQTILDDLGTRFPGRSPKKDEAE